MRGSKRRAETLTVEPEVEDAEESTDKRNGFFASYLLCSLCPRYKGHTYIGFTVNPRRRIRQHNGEIKCGAWRTKSKRPWEMVLCIHGFPSKVSALQFEWAWQHPRESKAVREAALSFKSLSGLANKIKLAYTMLTLPQWERFNLSLNFFSSKYNVHSAHCPRLPKHMKTTVLPMDELPCYSDNPILDDENDDHILKEREVHHIHEPISPSHPKNAESGEVEPSWMKIHDDGYELEQDLVHDFQRRDHHINEPISLIHHKIVESGEEKPMWMKFQDDHYELNDDHGNGHDPQGGEVREHETISLTHPENVESSEEPTWIKIHDDVCELEEDHDHDFLEREDHTSEPISLHQLKNVESDDEEPVWMKICDDGYELDEDQTCCHDLLEGEDHIHEPVFLSHPKNVESDEEKQTLMKIHDGGCELYHNHDIYEPISLNNLENRESDEEKKHDHDHVSIYLTRLNSMEFGKEKQHDHDVEEREDNVHGSISLSGPKILESDEEDLALNKMSNLDQQSITTCQRGAFLLDVIDLSTPPSCRVSCKRGKPMTSICMEIIDLTGSPV